MIRCIRAYRSAGETWQLGDVVTDEDHAAWLLRDARDSWEIVAERAVDDAPNRMLTNDAPKVRTRRTKGS